MEKLIRILKNWYPQIILFGGALIDFANDFLPLLLKEVNLNPEYATAIRLFLIAFAIYKSKKAPSSINPEKLYDQAHEANVKKG